MKPLLFISVFIKLLTCINAAKILAFQIVPTRSYANMMASILKNIAYKHEIIYYSITDETFNHPNITVIKIPEPDHLYMEQENIFNKLLKQEDTSSDAEDILMSVTPEYIENFLKLNIFQDLIHSKPKFDVLIMCYSLSEFLIQFAYHLDVPSIQIAASLSYPWLNNAMGNPNFLSYDHSLFTPELPNCFINRLKKYVKHLRPLTRYSWYLHKMNEVTAKYFPPNTPSIEDITKNTSILFVNTNEAMGYARPTLSNYVEIGGLHCKPPQPLSKDLEAFMESSGEHGVIYFSLGSSFQAQLPDSIIKIFVKVFKKLHQRVIWKVNADIEGLPENIKALKWCPQQDILGHKKTKLFITQGGILSLQETVYHAVPVLVLPIILDQPLNAKIVHKLGYGRHLPLHKFSEDTLFSELQEILSNSRYKTKAEEISLLMKDVQETPTERLKWWVDYVIRHKGFPIHRPNDDRYSWSKNVDIDILLFLQFCFLVMLVFIVILVKFILKHFYNYVTCMKHKTKIS